MNTKTSTSGNRSQRSWAARTLSLLCAFALCASLLSLLPAQNAYGATVLNITGSKTTFDYRGGESIITVTGTFAQGEYVSVGLFEGDTPVGSFINTSGNETQQTAPLSIPANTDSVSKNYTVKVSLDVGTTWLVSPTLQVTVGVDAPLPVITSISARPDTLPSTGGSSTITIGGSNIVDGITVGRFNSQGSLISQGRTTGDSIKQSLSLYIPTNSTQNEVVHTMKVSLDEGTTWETDLSATITQEAAQLYNADAGNNSFAPGNSGGSNWFAAGSPFFVTAYGDGQDEEGPADGSTRYIPSLVTANPTAYFSDTAPYIAQMTIPNPGTYTLSVTYRLERWDGAASAWVDTGETDVESMPITVHAAGSEGNGSKVSPRTGDDTLPGFLAVTTLAALALACLIYAGMRRRRSMR